MFQFALSCSYPFRVIIFVFTFRDEIQEACCSLPIKENIRMKKVVYGQSGGSKLLRRRCRSNLCRSLPYDINRRKPVVGHTALITPMTRILGPTSSPTLPIILQQPTYSYELTKHGKTEKFPVPLLSRSKSLEDLRDSPSKFKHAFQLLHCDDSSDGSCNGSNFVESPLSLSPRNSFFDILKGEVSIKQEIDSMSMRIEKLDVT